MQFEHLGDVVTRIYDKHLTDDDVLINVDTGERAIVKDGGLHFLTLNDYLSNEVPIVAGTVNSRWELEENLKEITIAEAIKLLADKQPVEYFNDTYGRELFNKVDDFLYAVKHIEDFLDGTFYDRGSTEPDPKYRKRTTSEQVREILEDFHLHGVPISVLSDIHGMSKRNLYFITSGAYFKQVYDEFMEENGEEIN